MFRPGKVLLIIAACVIWASLGGSANAQMRGYLNGYGGGFGYGGFWTGMPYGFAQNQQELPYFAKYPPVYYSQPVARTYGYSPFAYPPGTMTPEIMEQPQEIINPHVPAPASGPKPSDQIRSGTLNSPYAPVPKIVVNPYVDQTQLSIAP